MSMGYVALLLLLAQQPDLTRDTVVFAAPSVGTDARVAEKAALDELHSRLGPRLKELGLETLRSSDLLFGWQDPKDSQKVGRIQLSPNGDFVGVILVAPGKLSPKWPSVREQPETCEALVARIESYYERRFSAPPPCGEPGPTTGGDGRN